jgi:hypothetical protein
MAKLSIYFDESKKPSISFLNWINDGLWM